MEAKKSFSISCPIPIQNYPNVLLAHGGGGKLMRELIEKMILPALSPISEEELHDSAVFQSPGKKLAYTTDSYVVNPLFFPGGDIGTLAVNGTVNDLAMSGASAKYLSVGLIIEEGTSMETLWSVLQSLGRAAKEVGVQVVTGDTKVVDRGKGDGIFINTSGIGVIEEGVAIAPKQIKPGDAVIVSGDVARHGMAIMAIREGLQFESSIESDCAPVSEMVAALLKEKIRVHCLRDLTRGGLASAVNEIAAATRLNIHLEETKVPVREDVRAACEVLGLDPLYVACEGRFVCFVNSEDTEGALQILKKFPTTALSECVGQVTEKPAGIVTLQNQIGATRILDMLSGEQLPRIC